jgi:glycerol-3-phosphate dehydrogenase
LPEFNNMFTVVGGSMTLYRAKAEAAIDAAIARHLLPKYGCMTRSMRLGGNSQMAMEELQKRLLAGEAPAAEAIMQLNGFVNIKRAGSYSSLLSVSATVSMACD